MDVNSYIFFSSRRRHTICALVTGVQTCALPIFPTPFDARLILRIAPAVAQAAQDSGVATRPIADMDAYRQSLTRFITHTGMFMRPVFGAARANPKRVEIGRA